MTGLFQSAAVALLAGACALAPQCAAPQPGQHQPPAPPAPAQQKPEQQKPERQKPGQQKPERQKNDQPTSAASQNPKLEQVLAQMDAAAARFHAAQADVLSEQYQQVVDETDTQKGEVYFRRHEGGLEMALDITQPEAKYVLIKDGKARLYQPSIDQITEYTLNGSRQEQEGMFALGFGGRGHDLLKSFEVTLAGEETMDGVQAARLTLIPKSARFRNMFARIVLWIDPERDVSLQQEFDEPGGDWRKAHYTRIKLNPHLGEEVFKLHTSGHPAVVRP